MKINTLINITSIILLGFILSPEIMAHFSTKLIPGVPINIFRKIYFLGLLHLLLLAKNPSIFLSKPMILVYIYIAIFYFYKLSGYYDTQSQWFAAYNMSLYIAILLNTYYIKEKNYNDYAIVILGSIFFIFLSSLVNSIQLIRHPTAVRGTFGNLAARGYAKLAEYYSSIGIVGYGFTTGVSYLFPPLIWIYKFIDIPKYARNILIILILTIFYSIYLSSIVAPILIAVISIILSIAGSKRFKQSILVLIILISFIMLLPKGSIANVFYSVSKIVKNKDVSTRLNDIGKIVEIGINYSNPTNSVDIRYSRIPYNLKLFSENMLFGKGREGNAHIFWLNFLAQFGLVAAIPLLLIIIYNVKLNIRNFSNDFKYYYFLSVGLFLILGLMKAYAKTKMFEIALFIIPGIYYLKFWLKNFYSGKKDNIHAE